MIFIGATILAIWITLTYDSLVLGFAYYWLLCALDKIADAIAANKPR